MIWLWLKEDKPIRLGLLGGLIFALYGVVATWQTFNFGRVYATYGGIFILMALLCGWKVDIFKPDRYDIIGALVALVGVCIIMYMPRKKTSKSLMSKPIFYKSFKVSPLSYDKLFSSKM